MERFLKKVFNKNYLKYNEAVQLCLKKNVIITEELDNLLTPNNLGNLLF